MSYRGWVKRPMAILENCSTIVELLAKRAKEDASKPVFTFLDSDPAIVLTYAQLDGKARTLAAEIRRRNLSRQQLLLLFPPGLEFITSLFGCMYCRAIPVPVYPPMSDVALRGVIRMALDAQCTGVLTTSSLAMLLKARFGDEFMGNIPFVLVDELEAGDASDGEPEPCSRDDIAYLQYTSGSTGQPRGVVLTHGNLWDHETLWHRDRSHEFEGRLDEKYRMLNWLPLYHDMGLIGNVFRPVFLGIHAWHMSPLSFIQDPASWLENISKFGATVSGGPNFAYELCLKKVTDERLAALDLRSWKIAYVGAEKVRAGTLRRFSERFCDVGFDELAFYPCYGLAEATLQVTACRRTDLYSYLDVNPTNLREGEVVLSENKGDLASQRLVGCGSSCGDMTVKVVDPELAKICPPGKVGEIWFHADSVARGYWGRADLSQSTFRARIARDISDTEFLRTGDLGFIHDGQLYITGRIKDIIIVRGSNYAAEDIEETVDGCHPALRPGCSVAFSVDSAEEERVAVVAEVRSSAADELISDDVRSIIRRAVSEGHGLRVDDVYLVKSGSIPKTSSGKLRRTECRLLMLSGALREIQIGTGVASQPCSERAGAVANQIAEVWRNVLGRSDAKDNDHFFACGGDSLRAVQFLSRIHDIFGIELPLESIYDNPTPTMFGVYLKATLTAQGEDLSLRSVGNRQAQP